MVALININLSNHHLSENDFFLLSKGLKFVPTPEHINSAKIEEETKVYGMKLRLMRHFRIEQRKFDKNLFKKKSNFKPEAEAAIEMCLKHFEEETLSFHEKNVQSLTKGGGEDKLYICFVIIPPSLSKKLTKDQRWGIG